jgi:hypothetical protein
MRQIRISKGHRPAAELDPLRWIRATQTSSAPRNSPAR